MKKIGVISDTHIPKAAQDLPERIYKEFQNVDLILHAGDFTELKLFEKLKNLAPTHGVCGNMDEYDIKNLLPQKDIIKVNGFKIGLIHGYGPPARLIEAVSKEFARVDVIVFGHSHIACCEKKGKILFFNPGSPTDKIFALHNSFGILEVEKEIKGRIISLEAERG